MHCILIYIELYKKGILFKSKEAIVLVMSKQGVLLQVNIVYYKIGKLVKLKKILYFKPYKIGMKLKNMKMYF